MSPSLTRSPPLAPTLTPTSSPCLRHYHHHRPHQAPPHVVVAAGPQARLGTSRATPLASHTNLLAWLPRPLQPTSPATATMRTCLGVGHTAVAGDDEVEGGRDGGGGEVGRVQGQCHTSWRGMGWHGGGGRG